MIFKIKIKMKNNQKMHHQFLNKKIKKILKINLTNEKETIQIPLKKILSIQLKELISISIKKYKKK